MPLSLLPATLQDAGFIFSLAQNGARNGHFNQAAAQDKSTLRAYIQSVITRRVDLSGYSSEFSIAHLDGARIGVTLMTAALGIPDRGIELAMIALKKEYRGSGNGSRILDMLLDRYLPCMSVYARCYPASHQLQKMLLRRDFTEAGTSQGSTILRHGATGYLSPQITARLSSMAPNML